MNITFRLFIFSIALFSYTLCMAQTADEIIEKHIKALGGKTNIEKIENIKITGRFTAFSVEKDFIEYKSNKGDFYSHHHKGKHPVTEAYSNGEGWTIDPWMEFPYPRKFNTAENNMLLQKIDMISPFYKYKEKGSSVEYLGIDTIDGEKMHALKLTRKNGFEETWYLGEKTYLPFKYEGFWVDFTFKAKCESFFEDYQKVDGVLFPFYTERTFSQRHRVIQIEKIETNTDFDTKKLEMPKSQEIDALGFLVGDWDVDVSTWSRRGSWYPIGKTTSKIEYATNNMIQEKITYEQYFPVSKTINYSFNRDTEKYRVSIFNDLHGAINVFEGQLSDTSFVFDNSKVLFDGKEQKETSTQYFFSGLSDKSFTLELKRSTDKGESWNPGLKLVYTRKN